MPKKYPLLKPKEVESILRKLGFKYVDDKGDHKVWELGRYRPEVDQGKQAKGGFGPAGMKIIIFKAGLENDPESFYRANKRSAKKINEPPLTEEEVEKIKEALLDE